MGLFYIKLNFYLTVHCSYTFYRTNKKNSYFFIFVFVHPVREVPLCSVLSCASPQVKYLFGWDDTPNAATPLNLCHPLCQCDRCSRLRKVSVSVCKTSTNSEFMS